MALLSDACSIPEMKDSKSAGFAPHTPSLGVSIVPGVLVIFEILRESELGTLGPWEISVSSGTGDTWHCSSVCLCHRGGKLCALQGPWLVQVGALGNASNGHGFPKLPGTLPKGNKRLEYLLNCLL